MIAMNGVLRFILEIPATIIVIAVAGAWWSLRGANVKAVIEKNDIREYTRPQNRPAPTRREETAADQDEQDIEGWW